MEVMVWTHLHGSQRLPYEFSKTSLQHQSCLYVDEDLSDHIELLQAFNAIMETIPLNCLWWNSNKNFDNNSGFGKDPYGVKIPILYLIHTYISTFLF